MIAARHQSQIQPKQELILVMSSDAVAAALLGALVETLGYPVRFYRPPEEPTQALKRERPTVALLDAGDPRMVSDEVLGHAAMRKVSVVIVGSAEALQRIRELALQHEIHTLLAPPTLEATLEALEQAVAARS